MMNPARWLALCAVCCLLFACSTPTDAREAQDGPGANSIPVHPLSGHDVIRSWVVLGPFPNPQLDEPDSQGAMHGGFNKDYLAEIGGEASAQLMSGLRVKSDASADGSGQVTAQIVNAPASGVVDLDAMFGGQDYLVAYAYTTVDSDKKQTVNFFFGSDDGAKVWVNGKLVHEIYMGRGLTIGGDTFEAEFKEGVNTILVKVAERWGAWGFAMSIADEQGMQVIRAEQEARQLRDAFKNARVEPPYSFMMVPGDFPQLSWDQPEAVKQAVGGAPLKVRWFDAELNEVTKAKAPGRYAFVAEATSGDGRHIERAGTVYCIDPSWAMWRERPMGRISGIAPQSIAPETWEQNGEAVSSYLGRMLGQMIAMHEDGAILFSYLHDMEASGKEPTKSDTPLAREQDYQIALQRKLLGVEDKWPAIAPPRKLEKPARVLREGTPEEAGMKPDVAEQLHAVCEEWYEQSGEPFITLVARHGVIVYHEAVGEGPMGEVTLDTMMPQASITKAITGMVFAQFVDQGLIGIDDPVADYLPGFDASGEKAITVRQLFTHTTGLEGHGEWGGIHNPRLENVIASCPEDLKPGKVHIYNGMGYDLAGKVISMVAGKGIIRILREQLFDPIGAKNTFVEEDLGYSCNTTAYDLAMFGQMMANHGSYGDLQFFSPQTFEKLLPVPLNQYYPDIQQDWGIGFTWMPQVDPRAGKDGIPNGATLLSDRVIGHGSATSCVLRIDLDNDLVITQVRRGAGEHYDKYLAELILAVDQSLIDE